MMQAINNCLMNTPVAARRGGEYRCAVACLMPGILPQRPGVGQRGKLTREALRKHF